MKNSILFCIICIGFCFAQSTKAPIILKTTYSQTHGQYSSSSSVSYSFKFEGSNSWKNVGYLGNQLRLVMLDNPQALKELDQFKNKRTAGLFGWAAFAGGITMVLTNGTEARIDSETGEPTDYMEITDYGKIGLGVALVGMCVGGYTIFNVGHHLENAISIYNNDLNLNSDISLSLVPVLTFNQFGFNLQLTL